MPHTSFAAIVAATLADVALQFVLVGAVAAILVIALAFTLFSRSGNRDGAVGSAPPRARADEAKKSAPASQAAQRVGAAAPEEYKAPIYDAPEPRAPAKPATERDGVPISTPWAPAPEPYAPPLAQPAPQPSADGYGSGYGSPAPAPAAPGQAAPGQAAPAQAAPGQAAPAQAAPGQAAPAQAAPPPPPSYDAPGAPPPAAPEPESYPFAPSAGSSSSDIDWDAMEREQTHSSGEREEAKEAEEEVALPPADENAPTSPPSSVGGAGQSDDRSPYGGDWLRLGPADEKRAETPTAEELADLEPAAGGDAADDERPRGITLGGVNADRAPASAPTAASLQFTSFYPREVPTQQWQTLLVYTHIADALEAVRRDALKFAEELGERPRLMHATAAQPVERGTTLTIAPSCAGVRFNPERLSLSWDEDWQRSGFRFAADESLAGSAAAGEITVYVGPLIIAILKFGLLVSDEVQPSENLSSAQQQTVGPSSVFASYSHDDTPVVLACRNAYRALGLTVNIDVDALRSGDEWDPRLMQLIDGSDVFQLFWSARAANSEAVQREWRYALAHSRGAGYIRPVYWEQPLIAPPAELSNVHFAYIDLPRE